MKIILPYILAIVILTVSCQREEEEFLLGKPDQRLSEMLTNYKQQLVGSTYGWKGFLYPRAGGSFSFFIEFTSEGRVVMASDINSDCAQDLFESSYRLVAAQRPSLYFDTYSYIHILSDPAPDTIGGLPGAGLFSDFEFAFEPSGTDTVKMKGNLHGSEFVLIKATPEEAEAYKTGKFYQLIKNVTDYLTVNPYLFLVSEDGKKTSVNIDIGAKAFSLSFEQADTLNRTMYPFAFTTNGIYLHQPMSFGGSTFREVYYDAATQKLFIRLNGVRKDLKSSTTPVIPLHLAIGLDTKTIIVPPRPETEDWSSLFRKQWQKMGNGFYECCGLGTSYTDFAFDARSKKMYLNIYVVDLQSGRNYLLQYPYAYTLTLDGVFEFLPSGEPNPNGEYFVNITKPFRDYIGGHKFTMEYKETEDGIKALVESVDTPAFYFTANLK